MNVGRQSWQLNPDANGEELALEVLMDVFFPLARALPFIMELKRT